MFMHQVRAMRQMTLPSLIAASSESKVGLGGMKLTLIIQYFHTLNKSSKVALVNGLVDRIY